MKHILIASLLLITAPTFALAEVECPTDGSQLIEKIEAQTYCSGAARIARECAWGSSFDVQTTAAAGEICAKDFKKISRKDKKLMDYMNGKCNAKYENMQGTMYASMAAFCRLQVSEFWSEVYSKAE